MPILGSATQATRTAKIRRKMLRKMYSYFKKVIAPYIIIN
jgi:hypothetical protein